MEPSTPPSQQEQAKQPEALQPLPNGQQRDIPIGGRFGRYDSSYWKGLLAAFGLRYLSRPWLRPSFDHPMNSPDYSYGAKHKYSLVAGAIMEGVTAYYGMKTWGDIRSILAEAVAWEKNKEEKDVTFFDFWSSDNTIVKQTMNNFIKYNVQRALVNTAFFLPFIPGAKKYFERHNFTGEAGVDFGMAANSAYLLRDVIVRRPTPFEELQSLIDRKINHAEHFADKLVATDLFDIYERHATMHPSKSFMPLRGTEKWHDVAELFSRMADLMNQTYHNQVPSEHVEFGFSRFVYLVGHQMINPDKIDQSRAYVEIAAKYGVDALKHAHQQLKSGIELARVLKDYPMATPPLAEKPTADLEPYQPPLGQDPEKSMIDNPVITPSHQKIIEKKQPLESFGQRERAHQQEVAAVPAQLSV